MRMHLKELRICKWTDDAEYTLNKVSIDITNLTKLTATMLYKALYSNLSTNIDINANSSPEVRERWMRMRGMCHRGRNETIIENYVSCVRCRADDAEIAKGVATDKPDEYDGVDGETLLRQEQRCA
jgi:hypothetical protein